jgi:hypothetical protein
MHLYVAVVALVCASSSAFQPTEQESGSTPSSCALQPTEQVSGSTLREPSMLSASTSAASSSAFQPTEQAVSSPVFKAKTGKFPTRSQKNQDASNLAQNIARNMSKFTAAQKLELKELQDGALQPVVDLQALICEARDWMAKFGKFPIKSRTNKDECSLAQKLFRNKDKFTAAQKLELKELKDGSASDFFMKSEKLINEVKQLG